MKLSDLSPADRKWMEALLDQFQIQEDDEAPADEDAGEYTEWDAIRDYDAMIASVKDLPPEAIVKGLMAASGVISNMDNCFTPRGPRNRPCLCPAVRRLMIVCMATITGTAVWMKDHFDLAVEIEKNDESE